MPRFKDYLHLHFIVFIWGFTAILGKLISIPSIELVLFRTFIASLLLAILMKIRNQAIRISFTQMWPMLGTGFLIAAHWILFFGAAKLNASVCLAGMTTTALWTSILEPIVYRRKIRHYEILLGLVVIYGLYIIFKFEFNHIVALLMAIASAMLAAAFSVINSMLIQRHSHYIITLYEMTGACLATALFLPVYVITMAEDGVIHLIINWLDLFYIVILAGVCTVYAYSAGVKLMRKFTPFAVNLTVNMEPVYGIILAYFIFQEKMSSGFYAGTLIILVAIIIYPFLKSFFEAKEKSLRKI
jgi:drug/metabolite transporter (DMT)-like permease